MQKNTIPPCSFFHHTKQRFSQSRQSASSAVSLSAFTIFHSLGSLVLGISLFALTFLADSIVSKVILKSDPIFSMRRTLAVSFVCWVFWLVFIVLGVGLSFAFGWLLWVKLCLLGFAAVVTLRVIVFNATSSSAPRWRLLLSILLEPVLCIVAFLVFWARYFKHDNSCKCCPSSSLLQ